MSSVIPTISAAALFSVDSTARRDADEALFAAASGVGFVSLSELDQVAPTSAAQRRELLRIFSIGDAVKTRMSRQKFVPRNGNVYHGWFPLQDGVAAYKEGIDIGPDLVRPQHGSDDPLREPTPLPDERELPGWRAVAGHYYAGMEQLGAMVMRSLARGLDLAGDTFDAAFEDGVSTLRLLHYPARPPQSAAGMRDEDLYVEHKGEKRALSGKAHVDSGFVTLLAQDGVEGLQALDSKGEWIDVPPTEGSLAVNFGGLLELWSGGRIKATEHRVVGSGRQRFSIPFFYEPSAEAVIAPLPIAGAKPFEPFSYGDHVWAAATKFAEFKGLEGLRPPRGVGRGTAGAG